MRSATFTTLSYAFASFALLTATVNTAHAQSASNGKILYSTAQVTGQKSCSAGTCHGPDPAVNQNAIKNGASASVISSAIVSVPDMRFLSGALSAAKLADLAAYIANPGAANTQPIASLSTTTLGFGAVNTGTASAALAVTLSNTGAAALQLSAITFSSAEFARAATGGGTCAATTQLAVAASCTLNVSFTPAAVGVRTASLSVNHNGAGGVSIVSLAGTGVAASGSTTTPMVEYYFAALDYYFITSHASDIALLDPLPAWQRTGKTFNVFVAPQVGSVGINRYYFDQVAVNNTRGSHFYTLVQAEKTLLASLNPVNSPSPRLPYNEGVDSYAFAPVVEGVGGSCAAGLTPVFRIFRGQARFPDNPNHRFTTDPAIYNAFVAQGWDGEGVKFCVPG